MRPGLSTLQAKQLFASVWGCGDIVAEKWYREGHRNLDDVRKRTDLTMQQQVLHADRAGFCVRNSTPLQRIATRVAIILTAFPPLFARSA